MAVDGKAGITQNALWANTMQLFAQCTLPAFMGQVKKFISKASGRRRIDPRTLGA